MPGKCCVVAVFCYLSSVCVTHCVREISARSQGWDEPCLFNLAANATFKIKSTFWRDPPPNCLWATWNYFSEHWCDLHDCSWELLPPSLNILKLKPSTPTSLLHRPQAPPYRVCTSPLATSRDLDKSSLDYPLTMIGGAAMFASNG